MREFWNLDRVIIYDAIYQFQTNAAAVRSVVTLIWSCSIHRYQKCLNEIDNSFARALPAIFPRNKENPNVDRKKSIN